MGTVRAMDAAFSVRCERARLASSIDQALVIVGCLTRIVIMSHLLDELQQLAPWHFDLELTDGLRTGDGNRKLYGDKDMRNVVLIDPNELTPLLRCIYPAGLHGKRFLDVACNGGGYSIVAKRLGADIAVGFDAREHWIRQANFVVQQLGLDGVQFLQSSIDDFSADADFDICLFKGIFYHLPDPVASLRRVADMTREIIIIDTETDGTRSDLCLRLNREGQSHVMSGVDGLAWWPSGPDLLALILGWLGFPETREIFWHSKPNVRNRQSPGRCRIIGARSVEVLRAFDAGRPLRKSSTNLVRRRMSLRKRLSGLLKGS